MKVLVPTVVIVGGASVALSLSGITADVPQPVADGCRVMYFALAGITGGLMAFVLWEFHKVRIDPSDRFLRPLGRVGLGLFLCVTFMAAAITEHMGESLLTWKTPYAIVACVVVVVGLGQLLFSLRKVSGNAKDTDATVRMTLTDTSKPGPDIDLDRYR